MMTLRPLPRPSLLTNQIVELELRRKKLTVKYDLSVQEENRDMLSRLGTHPWSSLTFRYFRSTNMGSAILLSYPLIVVVDGDEMARKNSKRRRWTKTELRELKSLARAKTPAGKIARSLKRTEGATRQKAFSLGVSLDTRG
jgi:hypothetical protein